MNSEKALREALDAAHYYVDASDRELADAAMTRGDALDRARDLRRAAEALAKPSPAPVEREGAFAEWSTASLAGQCRMQAREQLDPEFSQSMEAVAARLAALAPEPVREDFLTQLRRVNTERYHAWVGDGQDAGILFDAAELGGEVGELLNVVKKLVREEAGWRGSRAAPEDFGDECGDVLICLDKLARRRGVDLAEAAARKFNATSDKVGLPHKLEPLSAREGE